MHENVCAHMSKIMFNLIYYEELSIKMGFSNLCVCENIRQNLYKI